jgi:hypothetical protein
MQFGFSIEPIGDVIDPLLIIPFGPWIFEKKVFLSVLPYQERVCCAPPV